MLRILRRLWTKERASGHHRKSRPANGSAAARRRLSAPRLFEVLEERQLLSSVSVLTQQFMKVPFSASGPATVAGVGGTIQLAGNMTYISPTYGTFTASGPFVTQYSSEGLKITASIPNGVDNNGAISATLNYTSNYPQYVKGGSYPGLTGTFNTSTFGMTIGLGNNTWSSTVTPTASGNFTIVPKSAQLNSANPSEVDFTFQVTGKPTETATADRTIPVTTIGVYWASGPNSSTILTSLPGGGLLGSIPVYWDQAGGTAAVGGINTPPSGASYLLFVAGNNVLPFELFPPALSIVANQPSGVVKGNSGTTDATFTVSLSHASLKPTTVKYATIPLTAAARTSYVTTAGTLTFQAGQQTKTITVPVVGNTLYDETRTFQVQLSSPTNGTLTTGMTTATGTILDDDPPPCVSIANVSVMKAKSGTTNATFTVSLSAASGTPVTVSYATANGGAHPATSAGHQSDYSPKSGTLTFNPGQTKETLTVPIYGNTVYDLNETFLVNLSSPTGATLATSTATGTIENNNPMPAISVSSPSVVESSNPSATVLAVFQVTLTGATDMPVTVAYTTANGTALAGTAYTAQSGTLTFTPGGPTTQTVVVNVSGSAVQQLTKNFYLDLSSPTYATLKNKQGICTIHPFAAATKAMNALGPSRLATNSLTDEAMRLRVLTDD
ncbi:MAG: Calx-beta domain-containing protein [Thermoguttaceae bacterium]